MIRKLQVFANMLSPLTQQRSDTAVRVYGESIPFFVEEKRTASNSSQQNEGWWHCHQCYLALALKRGMDALRMYLVELSSKNECVSVDGKCLSKGQHKGVGSGVQSWLVSRA
jgi:hypothetical protein